MLSEQVWPAEPDFSLLAYDTNSGHLDARAPLVAAQPELCHYKARYPDDDSPVDDWSVIVEVTVRP